MREGLSRWWMWGVLGALFVASVLLRLPFLNRPLDTHNEWLTARVLSAHRIWETRGVLAFRFLPVMTYENPGDRNIPTCAGIGDSEGNWYYVSYPPLMFIAPYVIFKVLGISAGVVPLQAFSIAIHLLTCLLLLALVERFVAGDERPLLRRAPSFAGALAFVVYLVAPGPMWYHSNVYFADMLAQPLLIGALLATGSSLTRGRVRLRDASVIGILVWVLTFTDWIGVLYACAVCGWCLMRERSRTGAIIAGAAGAGATLGLLTTIAHYSSIAGFWAFVGRAVGKYSAASGYGAGTRRIGHVLSTDSWYYFFRSYVFSYLPIFVILCALLVAALVLLGRRPSRADFREATPALSVICIAGVTVLLHHFILFKFTACHEFAMLKTGIVLAFIVAWLARSVRWQLIEDPGCARRRFAYRILTAGCVLMFAGCVAQYYVINWRSSDHHLRIGRAIERAVRPDDVVFVESRDSWTYVPQMMVYAGRNVARWTDEQQARELIAQNGCRRGVVFVLTDDARDVKEVRYVEPAAAQP